MDSEDWNRPEPVIPGIQVDFRVAKQDDMAVASLSIVFLAERFD
jgi:hypothetical protein